MRARFQNSFANADNDFTEKLTYNKLSFKKNSYSKEERSMAWNMSWNFSIFQNTFPE